MERSESVADAAADADIVRLGAKLFSDPLLSRDGTMSCATCHDPKHAFTTGKPPVREGQAADLRLRRDIPSLLGVKDVPLLHHDGGEPSLETQILAPLFNASEMSNTTFDDLTARIDAIDAYREAFNRAFGVPATIETLGAALAAYERTLVAGPAPFDAHGADGQGMPSPAAAGFELFKGKAGCVACHAIGDPSRSRALFTSNEFVNTGTGYRSEERRAKETPDLPSDRGREEVTHKREDRYKFRVPGLRNVELTAPYMHDGSLKTLEEAVAYYNAGGSEDPEKDPRIKPLGLSGEEQRQLVAFLKSLTSLDLKNPPGAPPP